MSIIGLVDTSTGQGVEGVPVSLLSSISGDLQDQLVNMSSIKEISGSYTTLTTDYTLLLNGNFTLTLHDASTSYSSDTGVGQQLNLNNIGTQSVTISGSIQGNNNPVIYPNEVFNIQAYQSNWYWKS